MSDTMTDGTIAAWHKKVGDTVESGELMAEIETDKATMEYESYHDGVVLHLGGNEGDSIPVDGVLAIVGEAGEDFSALLASAQNGATEAPVTEEATPAAAPVAAATATIDISGINAEIVAMPKMSDTMTEGTIAVWHKKVGDTVESGELMAEVETDKATMEYESYNDGVVLYLGAKEGEAIPVDGPMAIVGEAGADFETLLKHYEQSNGATAPVAEAAPAAAPSAPKEAAPVATSTAPAAKQGNKKPGRLDKVSSSPLARKLAFERGYNLAAIPGTGPNGRITKYDVDNFVPSASAPAASTVVAGTESEGEDKYNNMRKTIARRLSESKYSAPPFYLIMHINSDNSIQT